MFIEENVFFVWGGVIRHHGYFVVINQINPKKAKSLCFSCVYNCYILKILRI